MAVVGFVVLFAGLLSAACCRRHQGRCCSRSSCRSPCRAPRATFRPGWPGGPSPRCWRFRWRSWCGHRVITTCCGSGQSAACAALADQLAGPRARLPTGTADGRRGRTSASAAVDRPDAEAAISRCASSSQHDLPAGRPDHRQSDADATDRSTGLAAVGGADRIPPRRRPTAGRSATKQLVVACARRARRRRGRAGQRRPIVRPRTPGSGSPWPCRSSTTIALTVDAFLGGTTGGHPPARTTRHRAGRRPAAAARRWRTNWRTPPTWPGRRSRSRRPPMPDRLIDRLLGRHAPATVDGPVAAAQRILAGHITRRSVWFQNSLRGALGLVGRGADGRRSPRCRTASGWCWRDVGAADHAR